MALVALRRRVDDQQVGGRRNLIINGAMTVAARGTSSAGITGTNHYTVDRSYFGINTGTTTQEQSTDVPSGQGFVNSFKTTYTTAATGTGTHYGQYNYKFEGQDLQHLSYGTSSAKTVTFSFWMKSNVTGNRIARLFIPSPARSIQAVVTQNAADTWEYKTLTFVGDTVSSLVNTNGEGLRLTIWTYAGADFTAGTLSTVWNSYSSSNNAVGINNIGGTINDYFAITGVQLEVGSVATPFEHRSYSDELARCERYYQILSPLAGHGNGTNFYNTLSFNTAMRTQPTLSCASNTMDYTDGYASNYNSTNANPVWISYILNNGGRFRTENHAPVSLDARRGTMMLNSNISIKTDAEL